MQKIKNIQKLYKQQLKVKNLSQKLSTFKFSFQNDPLELNFADKSNVNTTSRHYGKLVQNNINLDDIYLEKTKIEQFVDAYRKHGHQYANIDPLGKIDRSQEFVNPLGFGLSYKDTLEGQIESDATHFLNTAKDVSELEEQLKQVYTSTVAVEFNHITSKEEQNWLYQNYEQQMMTPISDVEKRNIHALLVQTEAFDHYLHKKFNTFKRYSGEGVESSITALRTMLAKASEQGVEEAVIGIPHRGRLNVLCNVLDYPPEHLFRKIKGFYDMPLEYYNGIDDVISHIAISKTKRFTGAGCNEKPIHVSMMHNPSHLELINPSSMGKVRAKQDEKQNKNKVLNIAFHGDAAFTAQGVVYETFAISGVPKFSIGGTIHMIINNQIGYTTSVKDSRGHFYCSDIGKTYEAPIIHVNSDDPESIQKVVKFAVLYRQKFQKDIIIDLIGYRKYGHNELDEPAFTQPLYYKHIKKIQKSLPQLYNDKLVKQGIIKPDTMENLLKKVNPSLDKSYENQSKEQGRPMEEYTSEDAKGQSAFTKKWKDFTFSTFAENDNKIITGLNKKYLQNLGKQTTTLPADFNVHPRLKKFFLEDRNKQIDNNSIDWATAEAISISSLLQQGYNVRLSGEDVERGTFSQRHWVLVDQETEQEWNPIKDISEGMNKLNQINHIIKNDIFKKNREICMYVIVLYQNQQYYLMNMVTVQKAPIIYLCGKLNLEISSIVPKLLSILQCYNPNKNGEDNQVQLLFYPTDQTELVPNTLLVEQKDFYKVVTLMVFTDIININPIILKEKDVNQMIIISIQATKMQTFVQYNHLPLLIITMFQEDKCQENIENLQLLLVLKHYQDILNVKVLLKKWMKVHNSNLFYNKESIKIPKQLYVALVNYNIPQKLCQKKIMLKMLVYQYQKNYCLSLKKILQRQQNNYKKIPNFYGLKKNNQIKVLSYFQNLISIESQKILNSKIQICNIQEEELLPYLLSGLLNSTKRNKIFQQLIFKNKQKIFQTKIDKKYFTINTFLQFYQNQIFIYFYLPKFI